jgi:hypothetical protein
MLGIFSIIGLRRCLAAEHTKDTAHEAIGSDGLDVVEL